MQRYPIPAILGLEIDLRLTDSEKLIERVLCHSSLKKIEMITQRELDVFKRDGFLLLKNVFSAEEMSAFSHKGRSHPGTNNAGTSLALIPELAPLIGDDRILTMAKEILGPSASFFFEANYIHYAFNPGGRIKGHLHHDGKGTPDHLFNRLHQTFAEPYPVMRIGIYMQDTASQSGGLKVCPGSHLQDTSTFSEGQFSFFDVPSEPGDAVCFCLRTLHSPFALRRRHAPDEALSPWEENSLYASQPDTFLPIPEQRESIFIDFADAQPLSDLHIKSRAMHAGNKKPGLSNFLKDGGLDTIPALDSVGLRFDFAIIDAMREVINHVLDGKIQRSGLEHLNHLMVLCNRNAEYSGYFPFTPAVEKRSYSVSESINVLNQLIKRNQSYSEMLATRNGDPHMEENFRPIK